MTQYFKNILLIALAVIMCHGVLHAQQKKKRKTSGHGKAHHTTSRIVAPGFKKPTVAAPPKKRLVDVVPKKDDPITVVLVPKDTTNNPVDTAGPATEVVITSSFKPSLRNAAKINFTAATPILDTTKLQLTYNIPSQNLFFTYQPIPIKPLGLAPEPSFVWLPHDYVKAGYGNYSSPYLEAGASFGNGTSNMITAHGKYVAAKGSLPNEQYGKGGVDLIGIFNTKSNLEITSKLYFDNNSVYRYGYNPDTLKMNKDSLHNKFNTIGAAVGLQNKVPNEYGLSYHPQLLLNSFTNTSSNKETNLLVKVPLSKAFNKSFVFDLALTGDITHYSTNFVKDTSVNNNLITFNTSLRYTAAPNFKANIGLLPAWSNSAFSLLPNFTAEYKLSNNQLTLQGGWIGYYQKNTYKSLSETNPYIAPPSALFNTKNIEEYLGAKGSIGKKITANAKLSFITLSDAALYVNDTTIRKTQNFLILDEPTLQELRLKAEVSYAVQEKLTVLGGLTYTQFTKLSVNKKAYGLLPLELNGAMRWKVLDDLTIKSDVFFFAGSYYRNAKLQSEKLNPAIDANIGAEFPIMKKLNAWLQFNNLLNNKYQRWDQYQVLGFQLLAGVVYSFR